MAVKLLPRFYITLSILGLIGLNVLGYYLYKHNVVVPKPISNPPTVTTEIPLPQPKPISKPKVITHPINCTYIKAHAQEYLNNIGLYSQVQIAYLKSCLNIK